jgi:DNA mismatch repair protein MutL
VVRSLFYNVPARAKFLRSAAAEARAVSEVVTTLALANPQIAFSLESNDRPLLEVESAPELRARIASVWGGELASQLIPVAFESAGVAVTGLVQRPHAATPGPRRSYLFVNGRAFNDRHLVRAADRGYQTTVAPGVRPSLFLFLDVPDGQVDVNVHPTKAEVRFRDGIGVERAVEEGVRASLAPLESTPALGARPLDDFAYPSQAPGAGGRYTAAPPPLRPHPDAGARAYGMQQMSLFVASAEGDAEVGEGADARPETRGGLIIVDQHSAHERVMYEQIMRDFDERERDSQRLLFPITLRLSPAEFAVVEEQGGLFGRMGFEIEPFGGRAVIIHAVPSIHPYFDPERCLREMIAELTEGSPLVDTARTQHQRLALTFACKAAIKAGQKLSQVEMEELFDRLFATELPYHDIHGRPTVIQLSLHELHNRFRRSG